MKVTHYRIDHRNHRFEFSNCFFIIIFILAVCIAGRMPQANAASSLQTPKGQSSAIANPASVNCVDKGGELVIQKIPDDGEYGICRFKDGNECEEWAMMRGECPVGGVKVTGLATPAARYCVITGGTYTVKALTGTKEEQGTCNWKSGDWCEVWDYYNGLCGPVSSQIK